LGGFTYNTELVKGIHDEADNEEVKPEVMKPF
jgi:hypothetical protein